MSNPLYAFPTVCEQTLRALARYPERTAFSWPGGSITYQGATDLIGRIQRVFMQLGFAPGTRVAFLTANRADTWCAGVAAQLSQLAITWLHPLGSLDDQLFQLEDSEAQMLVIDGVTFRDRGGDLAAKAVGVKTVFTLGPAHYGVDLLQAIETAGHATPRCLAGPNDIATLNYTGGTTGKSKGALRTHREYGGWASAILADFEIPDTPSYLTVAPISHVAGTKVLPRGRRRSGSPSFTAGNSGNNKTSASRSRCARSPPCNAGTVRLRGRRRVARFGSRRPSRPGSRSR
jgi:fatty-acyl-CoA synthase